MLHRVFLTFIVPKIEKEYRQDYAPYLISEYQTLTTLILFVQSFVILTFITYEQYFYALYVIFGAVLIMLSRIFVFKYTQFSNFVYPFLQICVAGIFYVLCFSSNNQEVEKLLDNYLWYYGFFAAISHISIYTQGTILCYQTITMAGILSWHISRFDFSKPSAIFVACQIVVVFVIVFFCRREQERNKRLSYLKYKENMKWYQIMDKIVKKWTMFVEFDKSQDQLYLAEQSKAATQEFQLTNNSEFRQFIRNIYIEQTCSFKTQSGQVTIEDILRSHLIFGADNSESNYYNNLYSKYIGYQKKDGRYLKIKLVDYYMVDKKMVIMIIQNGKEKVSEEQKAHQFVDNCFRQMIQKSISLVERILILASPKELKLHKLFHDYNCFHAVHIWLNTSKYIKIRDSVNLNEIESQLKRIFRKQLSIDMKVECITLISSRQIILFICVNIIKFLYRSTKNIIELKITEEKEQNIRYYKFTFECEDLKLNRNLIHLLQENKYFNRYYKNYAEKNFKIITQSYINFAEIMDCNQQQLSLGMAVIKYLLLSFGVNNQIECDKNYLKLTFMDLDLITF